MSGIGTPALSSSSGGGGSVTQGTSPWVDNITQIGGAAISLGQALAAGSVPVVLTAAQISTLTPLTSVAVTNVGTFAVQATPVTQVDTFMLGGVNIKEINGVAPLMGNGTTGTGSLRVTIASDNTAFAVNATLSAETTKVIGTVNIAAAQTIAVTNTGTFAVQATLAAETTKVIGTVNQGTSPWVVSLTSTTITGNVAVTNAAQDAAFIAQEATTAGIKGLTAFGAVTTNAPSYTTAKSDALSLDTSGLLRISLKDTPANTNKFLVTPDSVALPANQSVNVSQINGHTALEAGTNGSLAVGGANATNVAITSNPVNLGAQAISSENTAVTATRLAQLVTDLVGKLIVLPYANPENFINGTTTAIVDTTTTSIIAAQAAGVRNYITSIIVTNSHASVGTFVKITDGASTILWEGYAASLGGGFTQSFPVPLRGSTATAVNAICVTTGANVIVSVSGYKGV